MDGPFFFLYTMFQKIKKNSLNTRNNKLKPEEPVPHPPFAEPALP